MTDHNALERLVGGRLGEKRLHHSLCVRDEARRLAGRLGVDEDRAMTAGILHDAFKETPHTEQLQYVKRHGILFDTETLAHPGVWHGYAAAVWAREELGVADEEILAAIRYHTTGRAAMSRLEEIVYLADFISADRDFFDAHCLRSIVRDSVERGIVFCLRYSINAVTAKALPILRDTWEAYNYYSAQE